VSFWADQSPSDHITIIVGVVSIVVGLAAIGYAVRSLARSCKNSSAASYITLNGEFRQAWRRYFDARRRLAARTSQSLPIEEWEVQAEFSELLNVFEIACAIHLEGSLVGVTADLAKNYLATTLYALEDDSDSMERLAKAIHSPTTLEHVRAFISKIEARGDKAKYKIVQ
jgi:hypothetical protein